MKIKLSPSRFYLSNIIFYTSLLALPLSATIEQVNQTENTKPSSIDSVNEWLEIDQEPSPNEQIAMLIKENNKMKEQIAEFQSIILIDAIDEKGMTPFLCAVKNRQMGLAKKLKGRGANIHAKDKKGSNALHWACYSGSVAIAIWLLDECNIDIESKGDGQMTSFLFAAQNGHLQIAMLLKKRGANLNAKDNVGNNALHLACLYSGSVPMVTWFLDECKLGLETKGQYQKTPFLFAAEKGQLAIAKLLKERGANINAKVIYRNNALHLACLYSGNIAMVTWLLDECKISIETKGAAQKTPFLCAVQGGQLAIAKLLKKRGADIHAKTFWGNNALNLADSKNVKMITWLSDECKLKKVTWLNWLVS